MTAALFGVLKCGTLVNAARRTLGKIPSSRRTIMRRHTLSGPTWRPLVGLWCGAQPTFLHNLTAHDLDIRAWQAYTKFNNRIAMTPSPWVAPGGGGPTRTFLEVRWVNR